MSYNISTMFIWEYFNDECICPVCRLRQKTEHDLINQYLNEAVMEDDERHLVNKYGFCEKHFDLLYSGRNKLGLALQASTRLNFLLKNIKKVTKPKDAKKQVETLKELTCDCIICKKIEFNMKRYFETICALYGDEERFRDRINTVNGFCIGDYIRLVDNVGKAGKYSEQLLSDLYEIETKSLSTSYDDLIEFTKAFDYHSTSLPSEKASSSIKITRVKFYGDKPLPIDK